MTQPENKPTGPYPSKTALLPLHLWLPRAHAGAPAPARAILSALVVKGSFFLVLRLWFDVDTLAAPLAAGSVFAGILDLLGGLHRALPMVAVTNKPTPLARAVLDAAGVLPFLEGVQGADRPELRKPAPAMLLTACERLGVAPQEMRMVGDSALDMQSAQAAGCRAVLVTWGYGHGTLPAWLDPLRVDAPDQLLQALLATRGPAVPILNS